MNPYWVDIYAAATDVCRCLSMHCVCVCAHIYCTCKALKPFISLYICNLTHTIHILHETRMSRKLHRGLFSITVPDCPQSSCQILWYSRLTTDQSTTDVRDCDVNASCGFANLTLHQSLQWDNALGSCFSSTPPPVNQFSFSATSHHLTFTTTSWCFLAPISSLVH